MDINATLSNIRAAIASLNTRQAADPNHAQAFNEIAEGFAALDEWISKGGFLPDAWNHNPYKQEAERVVALHNEWVDWDGDDDTDEDLRYAYIEDSYKLATRIANN